ncbi:hypothetical protein [Stenotrophomonas rhizophila]|uniref:hypothetical protein n=1 Tax=Stenotrophomonas rhizophila TaxID=216778 RepID=UPI00045693F8|nr:hypothetical protein [Stenotrophomonas rhizophila]AHY57879.1 hypothetical protein DX03_04060 [Stenotrophomonas rhizophila]
MLLDARITNFDALAIDADRSAIDTFKSRNEHRLVKIKEYILNDDNLIDADTIAKDLFPTEKADVFLSHTHQDHDAVVALAVHLEGLGLEMFVDSCVWGDVYTLLQDVDKIRSIIPHKPNTYYYERVTRTAASMYMILNVALQRMIDQSELLLFLDSKAVRIEDYVEGRDYIGSPWIFSELMFAQMVRRRPRKTASLESFTEAVARTMDSALPPTARFSLPGSSYAMAAEDLWQVIDDVRVPAAAAIVEGKPDGTIFLDAFYGKLKPGAFERGLLGW